MPPNSPQFIFIQALKSRLFEILGLLTEPAQNTDCGMYDFSSRLCYLKYTSIQVWEMNEVKNFTSVQNYNSHCHLKSEMRIDIL